MPFASARPNRDLSLSRLGVARALAATLAAGVLLGAHPALAVEAISPAKPTVSVVTGLAVGDILNIRAKAAPFGLVMGRVPNGTTLKNYGCSDVNGYMWCKVEEFGKPELSGWAPERYLQETESDEALAETDLLAEESVPAAEAIVPDVAGIEETADEGIPSAVSEASIATETAEDEPGAEMTVRVAESGMPPAQLPAEAPVTIAESAAAPSSTDAPEIAVAEQLAATQTVASAEPAAPGLPASPQADPVSTAAPAPRLSEWDRIALAGRALIVGEPKQVAALSPSEIDLGIAGNLSAPIPAAPAGRIVSPDAQRRDRAAPPVPVPPVDLTARLGGDAGQTPATDPQQTSTEAIGRTAAEDAYALAFAALDNPVTGGTEDASQAEDQPAELPLAALSAIPIPEERPAAPGALALEEQAVPPAQSAAVTPTGESATRAVLPVTDATGEIPCARYIGQPMTRCAAAVSRTGDDAAEVTVAWPDGGTRIIRFAGGEPAGSNSRSDFRFSREGALSMIRIGASERFEIVDALAFGD